MSTRKKESISSVREKRGTSPSPSHFRSSPKPSKTVFTSRSLDSSPSSDKTTPNYLKPTLSSSADATRLQGRRLVSNLTRRRSFDKPPSPTRTLKTRGVSPASTFRSASFSGKAGAGRAVTSPKSDRNLKGTRDAAGKQHLYARAVGTLKKSATMGSRSNKAETATASLRKKDASDHLESSIAEDSVVTDEEVDEDTLVEDEMSQKADSPTVSEQHVDDAELSLEEHDASIGKAESPKICDGSPTLLGQDDADKVESAVNSEQRVESPTVSEQTEGPEEKSCTEEISSSQQQHTANEMDSTKPDQSVAGNPNEDEEAEALDTKPEGEAGVAEEDGNEAPRLSHGKKDVALSNNVIEEMTCEQRRNKVRALAGAFETVISLQEHK